MFDRIKSFFKPSDLDRSLVLEYVEPHYAIAAARELLKHARFHGPDGRMMAKGQVPERLKPYADILRDA